MRKLVLLGTALVLTAMLMFSCNKNRFDFDHLDSVEGSGQWKLPIGSLNVTLEQVLGQLGENNLISPDENGNLQVLYRMTLNKIIKGSDFLTLNTFNFHTELEFDNPYPGVPILTPINETFYFQQVMELSTDSAGIETAKIRSGELLLNLNTNLGNVTEIVISSADITMPNGDSLVRSFNALEGNTIDLSGATFTLHDANGVADSTLVLNYAIHYQLSGANDVSKYHVNTIIGLNRIRIQEISGYIDGFVYDFSFDTTFNLPFNNVQGQLKLVGANIEVNERNTFGNLNASLEINQAEFYGPGTRPSPIFNHYPFVLSVVPSTTFVNVLPEETIDLEVSTDHNGIRLAAQLNLNPEGAGRLITICDTSSMDLQVNAVIPLQFNVPGVYYLDTLDLNMSNITTPSLVKEILLSILFKSEIPFNLSGQLYTLDSSTGRITDSLMTNAMQIGGSFSGDPVLTNAEINVTQSRLSHLLEADKLVLRFGVNTDNHDVILNLGNSIGMTIKADVIYGGEVSVNN